MLTQTGMSIEKNDKHNSDDKIFTTYIELKALQTDNTNFISKCK